MLICGSRELWLPKTRLRIKGAPNWQRFLGGQNDLTTIVEDARKQALSQPVDLHDAQLLHISCNTCGHSKPSAPSRLLANSRWKYTWCKVCKKNISAALWKCACNIPWHCADHSTSREPEVKRHKVGSRAEQSNKHLGPLSYPNTQHNHFTRTKTPARTSQEALSSPPDPALPLAPPPPRSRGAKHSPHSFS